MDDPLPVIDLGRLPYAPALETQRRHHAEVLAGREVGGPIGRILTVEHDPVITVSRRPDAPKHLLATPELLARHGVEVHPTDRGGDITYHGPGQVVVYPIIDLRRVGLRVVEFVRTLEQAVIDAVEPLGVPGRRDPEATGVWIGGPDGRPAKLCAIGVRVSKWVTMHGLAVNVRTNLDHFGLIVPCGLAGRAVTSLERELGPACPETDAVRRAVAGRLRELLLSCAIPGPGRT